MKTFRNSFLILILFSLSLGLWTSCTPEDALTTLEPSYEQIVASQSFQSYYDELKLEQSIRNQYVIFDIKTEYSSKKEKINALKETNQNAKKKAALMEEVVTFIKQEGLDSQEKEKATIELINFLNIQDAEDKIKQSVIDYFQYKLDSKLNEYKDELFDKFPSITHNFLVEMIEKHKAAHKNHLITKSGNCITDLDICRDEASAAYDQTVENCEWWQLFCQMRAQITYQNAVIDCQNIAIDCLINE